MATFTWPSSLPQYPQRNGATKAPFSETLTTSMSVGYSKVRRRYTGTYYTYNLIYEMTLTELSDFEDFFEGDLGFGVNSIELPDPFFISSTITGYIVANQDEDPYSITPYNELDDTVLLSFSFRELS